MTLLSTLETAIAQTQQEFEVAVAEENRLVEALNEAHGRRLTARRAHLNALTRLEDARDVITASGPHRI